MKELEKTKRISISAVLFLLVFVIGVLTFEKPKYIFEKSSKATLKQLVDRSYILTAKNLKALDSSTYQLIDIRDNFEYNKGYFRDAINIPAHQILEENHLDFFDELKNNNKTVIIYGKIPEEANSTWMLLYQLGYENVKILCMETEYIDNKFQTKNYGLEKPSVNYAEVITTARKSSKQTQPTTQKSTSKRTITVRKKKKKKPEGGC